MNMKEHSLRTVAHELTTLRAGRRAWPGIALTTFLLGASATIQATSTDETISSAQQARLAVADSLETAAKQLLEKHDRGAAVSLYERALATREEILGKEHPDVARSLRGLAEAYAQNDQSDRAEPLFERALAIREKALGPEHVDVAESYNDLGLLYWGMGEYDRAKPLFERALQIREKSLGSEHPDFAKSLDDLGALYWDKGDYAKAETLGLRALAIREKVLGPEHLDVGKSLYNVAFVYVSKGAYARAETLGLRALAIKEKALGPEHPDVAGQLQDLGWIYRNKGDYYRSGECFERALAIKEKVFGPEHSELVGTLNGLAQLYGLKGDHELSERLRARALAIGEATLGPENPSVAVALYNMSAVYRRKGDYAGAESLLTRSLTIFQKKLGPEHAWVAMVLQGLGFVSDRMGAVARAESLHLRALAIREKTLGAEHPDVAQSLDVLASLHMARGESGRAAPLYERALQIREKALGPDHQDVATTLAHIAESCRANHEQERAFALQARSSDILENDLNRALVFGSEEQKRRYANTVRGDTDLLLSLHTRSLPDDSRATRLALTHVIRRKGRALEASRETVAAVHQHMSSDERVQFDRLADVRSELASYVLHGAGHVEVDEYRRKVAGLVSETERLETELSARSARFRAQSQLVSLEQVQAAIPLGSALVEMMLYRSVDPGQYGRSRSHPRYAAYVLQPEGDPSWTDLGEARDVDSLVGELREALATPRRSDVKELAREVDERVMRPVRGLLDGVAAVLLSPDGVLSLVPFGCLVDEQGRYLLERYSFTYLTSGRDLLRLKVEREAGQGFVIVANPDFGPAGEAVMDIAQVSASAMRSQDLSNSPFLPLPGTRDEAKAIRDIFGGAQLLMGGEATEAALKALRAPRILHIATHGFFLEDEHQEAPPGRGIGGVTTAPTQEPLLTENPLLRSGLALAGANRRPSQGEDGILTALEASTLDLWGTKLVVLSACETGVGEVRNGEGVYGLRRAFVLAGAETLLMSLWTVADKPTRDLMTGYYKRLKAGEGRSEALRQVQLTMLRSRDRSHPYYWASFIPLGDWRSLDGKPEGVTAR